MSNLPLPKSLSLLQVLQRFDVEMTQVNIRDFLTYQIPMYVRLNNTYLICNEEIQQPEELDGQFGNWFLTKKRFYKLIELRVVRTGVAGSWQKKNWKKGYEPLNEPVLDITMFLDEQKEQETICMVLTPKRRQIIEDRGGVEAWLKNEPFFDEKELAPCHLGMRILISEVFIYKEDIERFEQRDTQKKQEQSKGKALDTRERNSYLNFIKSLADYHGIDLFNFNGKQLAVSLEEGKGYQISENTVRKLLKELKEN